jgi:carbamoyltransferase
MITLGIHDGHTATACIIQDGRIIACISEERLKRIKEWGGFPEQSILECLKIANIQPSEIDGVGVVGLLKPTFPETYSKPHLPKRLFSAAIRILPESFSQSNIWVKPAKKLLGLLRNKAEIKSRLRSMGITPEPTFYEHHFLHAAEAHFCSWSGTENNLVITCDGSGDAVCATVNIARGKKLERIVEISNYNSIGEFYTQITQYLGMKPMSHEYKVMGLASYAEEEHSKKTFQIFERFFDVNGNSPLMFRNTSKYWKWRFIDAFRTNLSGHRFDHIARAAQALVEKIIITWIRNCVAHTGIRNLVLSGGVFLNVKVNELILNLQEVERLFIFPSCGDESLAIGAAIVNSLELGQGHIEPLGPIYYGQEFSDDEIQEALTGLGQEFIVEKMDDIDEFVGKQLAQGRVIARFSGRMEWGNRALGNRSILADPRNRDVIIKINTMIKNRDFWMPFAPSILEERADEYVINPKSFYAPYMIMAFRTKEKARKDLIAALHPYDLTVRPQIVRESWNPSYYRVLKTFEKETGVGGTLNTSFNLHGDAIVCSPLDALYTLKNSALDGLAIGHYFVSRYKI